MYVVTFVVFLVLSERLEQGTSKHVCNVFWNIKTAFRSNRTEQNVKSRQSLITSSPNYHEQKLGFSQAAQTYYVSLNEYINIHMDKLLR